MPTETEKHMAVELFLVELKSHKSDLLRATPHRVAPSCREATQVQKVYIVPFSESSSDNIVRPLEASNHPHDCNGVGTPQGRLAGPLPPLTRILSDIVSRFESQTGAVAMSQGGAATSRFLPQSSVSRFLNRLLSCLPTRRGREQ